MTASGIVFDLDGTLVDNMNIHAEAFEVFLRRYGLPPFTPELRERLDGKRNRDIFPILFNRELPADELARYTHEKESLYREISVGRLAPMPGLDRFLDRLAARRIPVAIATSAPKENVEHTLQSIGMRARFPIVARSDEVPRGKPFPDVFLAAAKALGVPAETCIAFEDAPAGIAAARAAGMRCLAVLTNFKKETLAASSTPPDDVVRDYVEVLDGAWAARIGL